MKPFISNWARFVVANRVPVIVASVLLAVAGLVGGHGIGFDHTIERNFSTGDPRLAEFDQLLELFGDNEYVVVGIEARTGDKDVFIPQTLETADSIVRFLQQQDAVTQVRSITRYEFIRGEDDTLVVQDLIDEYRSAPLTAKQADAARAMAIDEPLAIGALVSDDLRELRIAARIDYRPESPAHKVALMQDLYRFVEEQNFAAQGYRIRFSGQPVFDEQFESVTKKDSAVLYPVMGLIMIAVLFIGLRSLRATLLPWAVIGIGIVVLTGLQGLLGFPNSVVNQALMPTMIIVGIGVTMHVIIEFFRLRAAGQAATQAATGTVEKLWMPALFTSVTTSIGFVTLAVTRIVPVREMAILGAIGSLLLFLLAFTLLPAILSFSSRATSQAGALIHRSWIARAMTRLPDVVDANRGRIIAGGLALVIFAGATVPLIKVDTNFVEYFAADNSARQDIGFFDEHFGGALTMEVIVDAGSENGIKEPAFLRRVEQLQASLDGLATTGKVISVVDYLKEINQSLNGEDPAFYRLPDTAGEAAQLLFMYENAGPDEDLSDLRDFDYRQLRLTVPMVNLAASQMNDELAGIRKTIDSEFADLAITLTGLKLLFQAQDIYTNEGMVRSLSLALIVISLLFIVLFRSFKYGMLCVIPSVLPILITGGVIGLLGLNLDLGTMIVGAMTMGIAVDDSIHLMSRYLRARNAGENADAAIRLAMSEAGRAVVFSSIVLVLGFSVLMLGSFIPMIYVGLFSACIMFLALLGDLLLLPAMLYLIDGRRQPAPAALPLVGTDEPGAL